MGDSEVSGNAGRVNNPSCVDMNKKLLIVTAKESVHLLVRLNLCETCA